MQTVNARPVYISVYSKHMLNFLLKVSHSNCSKFRAQLYFISDNITLLMLVLKMVLFFGYSSTFCNNSSVRAGSEWPSGWFCLTDPATPRKLQTSKNNHCE